MPKRSIPSPPSPPSPGSAGKSRHKVLSFMRRRLGEGAPPSVREVQRALGFSAVQSAQEHLDALVQDGELVKLIGQARGYRLPGPAEARRAPMLVPLVGRVQAGALTVAAEEREGFVRIEARRGLKDEELFALRVRGESMTGAGILAGDIVIVRRQSMAASGDIVVALVDDEATVKTLRTSPGRVVLEAANPRFAPIVVVPPRALVLLGRVIEVRRYLDGFAV